MMKLRQCVGLKGVVALYRDEGRKALRASRFSSSVLHPPTLRILVVEAYSGPGMKNLEKVGATPASDLMQSLLARAWATPKVHNVSHSSQPLEFTVLKPALLGSPDDFPSAATLTESYDAVAWTGSNLTIWETADPLVRNQVHFCRRVYSTGLPQFGSCWGMQIAAAAVGIPTEANPKGREQGFGFGGPTKRYDSLPLSPVGDNLIIPTGPHPFYDGKDATFRGLAAHTDQVSAEWALEGEGIGNSSGSSMSRVRSGVGPAGPWEARVLSGNAWSPVQAMAIKGRCTGDGVKSDFWATQYHTEFSLKDVAQLTTLALPLLVKQGLYESPAAVEAYAASLHALHEDPQNLDLRVEAAQHAKNGRKSGSEKNTKNDDDDEGVFAYLDQPEQQLVEASNWLSKLCLPHQKAQLEDGIGASASSAGAAFTQHSANAKVGGGGSESSSSSSNGGSVIHGHTEDNDEPTTKTTSEAAELCAALGWKIVPTSPALGCELLGAKVAGLQGRKLGSAELAAIRAALLEYQVIFFRDQVGFSPSDHETLAGSFGTMQDTHPAYPYVPGHPHITVLENDRDRPSLIEQWHTDMTFRQNPPLGSILHGVIIPPGGKGDTEFLSLSAALEALPYDLQCQLCSLEAEHSFEHGFKESLAQPGGRERLKQALIDNPPVVHPLVRTHPESGRQAIFVNTLFTTRILGLPDHESDALLNFLHAHVTKPEFTCRFRWQPDSIAFWDNRITQHRPVNDYWPLHRKLQRITIDGDRPYFQP